jgi:putative oxygen-independent coproporphyrinogen III oxidase
MLPPPTSAYLHIPFCRRRCFYCDFPIAVVGDRRNGSNSGTITQYVEMLCQEIRLTHNWGQPLQTVFLGGGTPSLLTVAQLATILETLDQHFGIVQGAEISIEIDPGTFDLAQVQGYRSAGVNRVSLGVQAFQSDLLALCGRTHTVEDVYQAVTILRQAEIENFSLDLISGLPQLSIAQWQDSLTQAIGLRPKHLSIYDLTIEPMTPFGKHYQPGATPLPSDATTADMYRLAQQTLTAAGYSHYEISNYAQPGYQCRHNRVYWENRPFYGFGMGATSYVQGDRVGRPRKTREYYTWVAELEKAVAAGGGLDPEPAIPEGDAARADRLLDTLMVGLRLAEGISVERLTEEFGAGTVAQIWHCLRPFQQQGWVAITEDPVIAHSQSPPSRLQLTDPEGFLFSNVVLVKLFETLGDALDTQVGVR